MATQPEMHHVDVSLLLWNSESRRPSIYAQAPDGFDPRAYSHRAEDVAIQVGRSPLFDRPVRIPTASFHDASLMSLTATPKRDQGVNPWLQLAAFPLGLGALGAASGALTHPGERLKYAWKYGTRGFGSGLVLDTATCMPQTVEVAPAPSTESVKAELTPWLGHEMNGYTLTGFPSYYDKPSQLLHPQLASQEPLSGYYTIAIAEGKSSSGALESYNFLVALDAQGNATDSYYIHYTPQTEAVGLVTNAELLDKSDKKIADFYFNADFTDQSAPMATVKFLEPTPVPNSGAPVNLVELKFSDGASIEEKQNMMDTLMSHTLTGNVLAAGEGTLVPPSTTPTSTEAPTAVPTPTESHLEAGPRPAGETVYFDATTKEWAKPNPEDATKPFYYKTVEGLTQGWFKDIVINPTYQGGMPLADAPNSGIPASLPVHVWCEEGLSCPSLQHFKSTEPRTTSPTFSSMLFTNLYDNNFKKEYANRTSDQPTFMEDLAAGNVSLPFTVGVNNYTYNLGPDSSMNIYVVKEMSKPDFSKIFVDAMYSGNDQGDFNVAVHSPTAIESLSHQEFMDLLLSPTLPIFWTSDLSQASILNTWSKPNLQGLTNMADDGDNPHFVITP